MRSNCRESFQILQKCSITTAISSLYPYENLVSGSMADALLIYNCLHEENVETVPAAHYYEIIIDFNNDDIYNILVKIFNKLLGFDCDVYVKILEIPRTNHKNVEVCMELLRKLESKNLIGLKIQNEKEYKGMKDLLEHPLDNVTCFIGPGNTGKTSVIASVSELFGEKEQRLALLDLTKEHKLREYFLHSINLSHICIDHDTTKQFCSQFESRQDDLPYLYAYHTSTQCGYAESASLCKTIIYLSKTYDFVLINADEYIVSNFIELFKLFKSIFIVHDCMLNKINQTHRMLLNLQESGIDTQKNVSIIYNKVVKKASDMGNVEEKLIFRSDEKGRLIPLLDIKCMTLEIFHSKKIAIALNDKIMNKENALNKASLNYIINVKRLYNFINNLNDYEYSDLKLREFICKHVYDIMHYFFSTKINQILKHSITINNMYKVIKVELGKGIKEAKEIRNRYFKDKFLVGKGPIIKKL